MTFCKTMNFLLSCFLQAIVIIHATSASVKVDTHSGPVIGSVKTYNAKQVRAYLGIPFAKPPVGDLRFKKPVAVDPWTTALKATKYSKACPQYFPYHYPWIDESGQTSEDCLNLNIWTPASNSTDLKAVMFWIYGGGFTYGSNRLPLTDGGTLAAEGDVIVVEVNYRLGILGFLSTSSPEVPGNMGLYDILEALKWVNKNIEAFGGNKKSITLFGCSAGSIAIGLFSVSPLTKGLFSRITMQSGAPLYKPSNKRAKNDKLLRKVSQVLNCTSESPLANEGDLTVLKCLKGKKAEELVHAVNSINPSSGISFLPVVDGLLIPSDPKVAIKAGLFHQVPLLIGYVQDEGSLQLPSLKPEVFGPYGELDPKINKTFGKQIILEGLSSVVIADPIADYYLKDLPKDKYDLARSQTYHCFGDFILVCPTLYFAEEMAKKNTVYRYYYNHQSSFTIWAKWMGVTHYSEVPFIFGRPLDKPSHYTKEEAVLSKRLIKIWSNFAKYGKPARCWRRFAKESPYTKYIATDNRKSYLKQHNENCEYLRKYFLEN